MRSAACNFIISVVAGKCIVRESVVVAPASWATERGLLSIKLRVAIRDRVQVPRRLRPGLGHQRREDSLCDHKCGLNTLQPSTA